MTSIAETIQLALYTFLFGFFYLAIVDILYDGLTVLGVARLLFAVVLVGMADVTFIKDL
jgi:hypothetical protein